MASFFVSYNKADKAWAAWIAWQLEAAGYSTILQDWDFRPGDNFVLRMHEASKDAERTIAVLSPSYLKSSFTQPEWAAAFVKDPTGRSILPIVVQKCAPSGLLAAIVHVDILGLSEDDARQAILAGAKRGRQKPKRAPRFPVGEPKPSFPGALPRRRSGAAAAPARTKQASPDLESDGSVLMQIRAKHLIELDTIDLDYDLARVLHDRKEIEAIVRDAETLLRTTDHAIDGRSAIFGVQNLPSQDASAQRIWKVILMEAPLKSPRALAAILLRARRVTANSLPKLNAVLKRLIDEPASKTRAPRTLASGSSSAGRRRG
jgi:hypothetical protein